MGALLLLPFFGLLLERMSPGLAVREPELALVGFHTFFNVAGLVCVLPFAARFAGLVERLVPDRPSPFTNRLDRRWLNQPDVALRAIGPTLSDLVDQAFAILRHQLSPMLAPAPEADLRELLIIALDEVSRYVADVPPAEGSQARLATSILIIDELGRLLHREGQPESVDTTARDPELSHRARHVADCLPTGPSAEAATTLRTAAARLAEAFATLESERAAHRELAARRTASNDLEPEDALAIMDAYRWLERSAYHAWQLTHHLDQLSHDTPTPLV